MSYKVPLTTEHHFGTMRIGSGLSVTNGIVSANVSPGASPAYGEFYSTITQTNPVINTPNIITLNVTKISNGISLVNGSRIVFTLTGTYLIELSMQVAKPTGSLSTILFWLRSNGTTPLPYSGRSISIQGTGASNLSLATGLRILNAGDYLEALWQTDATNVTLPSSPPNTIPGIPSVQFSAVKVG